MSSIYKQIFTAAAVCMLFVAALMGVLEASQLTTKLTILAALPMVSLVLLRAGRGGFNAG